MTKQKLILFRAVKRRTKIFSSILKTPTFIHRSYVEIAIIGFWSHHEAMLVELVPCHRIDKLGRRSDL
jgi:hypothetical protein